MMGDPLSATWKSRFMDLADLVSIWSKDPSTSVGAVIVSPDRRSFAIGYNGFPAGMADDWRLNDREQKYPRIIHAEINALLNARFDVTGCHLFVQPFAPCQACASAIIQARIAFVYHPPIEEDGRWSVQQELARADMIECGVQVVEC